VIKTDPNLGERVLLLPNGQREVHYKGEMVRDSILLYVMSALSNGIFNKIIHEAVGKEDSVRNVLMTFNIPTYFHNCQAPTCLGGVTILTAVKGHKSQNTLLIG
jgi:hypothetical protein